MDYLKSANLVQEGCARQLADQRRGTAASSIIGGGDTGADCLGTVHRQKAASVAGV